MNVTDDALRVTDHAGATYIGTQSDAIEQEKEASPKMGTEVSETGIRKDDASKLCPYCKKVLAAPNARFCTECSQWQDLRGWMWSQFTVGDLALYGSVLVLLFTTFGTVFFGNRAEMEATVLNCSNFVVTAYVSNLGNASGVLTEVTMRTEQGSQIGEITAVDFKKTDESSDNQTILAGTGHVFRLSAADADRPGLLKDADPTGINCNVRAEFSVIVNAKAAVVKTPANGICSCADFVNS